MHKKKLSPELNQRLKSYAILAGAAVGTAASAQIGYTDIDDVVIDDVGEYYDLDLNNDGVVDFRIDYRDGLFVKYGDYYEVFQKGINISGFGNNNRFQGKSFGKFMTSPYVLDDSATIYERYGKNGNFRNSGMFYGFSNLIYNGTSSGEKGFGYWDENIDDKFVGMYFYLDGSYRSAWLRLDFRYNPETKAMSAILKDYAYKQVPDGDFYAGVKGLETLPSVSNVVASDIGDNYNASDLQVSWDAAADETNIDNYYLILVKTEQLENVTLDELIRLEGGNGIEIYPDGSDSYQYVYDPISYDMYGDIVIPGVSYTVVVYSVDNDFSYGISRDVSNAVTLNGLDTEVLSVKLKDVSDYENASDMQISFTKAENEVPIDEYRIMVVPSGSLNSFDSSAAAGVTTGNYTTVDITGSDHEITLSPTALTYTGTTIDQNTDYYAFVVSVLSDGNGFVVSPPSNMIALYTFAPVMTDLVARDTGDVGGIVDLKLTFQTPASFANINNFYFNFVPVDKIDNFSDEDLLDFSDNYYSTSEFSISTRDSVNFDTFEDDVYGNIVREGVEYYVYIVTNPNGGTFKRAMSEMVRFTLTSPISAIDAPTAAILPQNGNASDILIMDDRSTQEGKLSEYRIMAVPTANVGSFNLASANAVTTGNYLALKPNGMDIMKQLSADFKDANGNAIDAATSYTFFILGVANETTDGVNALSEASNSVKLITYTNAGITAIGGKKLFAIGKDIHIDIPELTDNAQMYIFSTTGAAVDYFKGFSASDVVTMDEVTPGIYIVKIVDTKNIYTGKILIK